MRRNYALFFTLCFSGLLLKAQDSQIPISEGVSIPYSFKKKSKPTLKTVSCIDSVRYPQSKLSGSPETGPLTNNTAAQTGISQAFHLSSPATINGIGAYLLLDFDGISGNFAPVTAKIKVYNIDGQNYPTTPLDSAMVQVSDVGFNEQVLMFSNPISVSDSFAIAIEMGVFNAATDTIWYTTNICGWNGSICAVGDGNNEDLSCVLSPDFTSANGSNWFNNNIEVFGWNIDFLMHPIVETDITSLYTVGPTSACPNDTITFLNASSVNTDAMFNMFNSSTNPLYEWDFDDGTGVYTPFDTNYAYSSPGNYNTSLTVNYYGYTQNCFESSNESVTIHDTAIANFGFSHLGGGQFSFADSSSSAMTWTWDFGDGNNGTSQNEMHTYATPGNYEVCLTVTDTNGCNQNTFCDSVSFVLGVEDVSVVNNISVYPIPANKHFNINVPNKYFGGQIVITDVVGKKLKSIAIENSDKIKVLTEGISSGIYFVSIDYLGDRVYTQRIVIDK